MRRTSAAVRSLVARQRSFTPFRTTSLSWPLPADSDRARSAVALVTARRLPVFALARPAVFGELRGWQLTTGLVLVLGLALAGLVGTVVVGESGMKLGSSGFVKAPTIEHPLGTDASGRDVAAFLLHAILPT